MGKSEFNMFTLSRPVAGEISPPVGLLYAPGVEGGGESRSPRSPGHYRADGGRPAGGRTTIPGPDQKHLSSQTRPCGLCESGDWATKPLISIEVPLSALTKVGLPFAPPLLPALSRHL